MRTFFSEFLPSRLYPGQILEETMRKRMERILNPAVDAHYKNLLEDILKNTAAQAKDPIAQEITSIASFQTQTVKTVNQVGLPALNIHPSLTETLPADPTLIDPAERINDAAKKALDQPDVPPPFPLTSYIDAIKKISYKGFLTLVPLFMAILRNSKEQILQNPNVKITAKDTPVVYQIGFGSSDGGEIGISFEVIAGQSVRFLHLKDAEGSTTPPARVFKASSTFLGPLLGPLNSFVWKRKEIFTDCNIIIEDAGNPALKEGAITTTLRISDHEGFNIIQIDPTVHQLKNVGDFFMSLESSKWAEVRGILVQVSAPITPNEQHRTQLIPLPFKGCEDKYLSITQFVG